jgi:hypothetical protein
MPEFLVELYVSKTNCGDVAAGAERLGRAAAELTAEGSPVRVMRSIFVPEDDTCYVLTEAATAELVRDAASRAAVAVERVVEATYDSDHR